MRGMPQNMKEMATVKKLWIGLAVLAVLTPLGLLVPSLFGAGGAWGEWGIEEVRTMLGFVPEGMERLSGLWKSPLPDYTVPGQEQGMARVSLGYFATAVIGIAMTAGLAYLLAKILGRRNKEE